MRNAVRDDVPVPFHGSSPRLWRCLFTDSPARQAVVDGSGRFIAVNSAYAELVGRTPAELEASSFQAITHPDDIEADVEMVRRCVHGDAPGFRMAKRYLTPFGATVWVALEARVVTDDYGRFSCFHSVVTPIEIPMKPEMKSDGQAVLRPSASLWMTMREDPKTFIAVVMFIGAVIGCVAGGLAWVYGHAVDYHDLQKQVQEQKAKIDKMELDGK